MFTLLSSIYFKLAGVVFIATYWMFLYLSSAIPVSGEGVLYLFVPLIIISAWSLTPTLFLVGIGVALGTSLYDQSFIAVYFILLMLVASWLSHFILDDGIADLDLTLGIVMTILLFTAGDKLGVTNPIPLLTVAITILLTNLTVMFISTRKDPNFFYVTTPVMVAAMVGLLINVILYKYDASNDASEVYQTYIIPLIQFPVAMATLLAPALVMSKKIELQTRFAKYQY